MLYGKSELTNEVLCFAKKLADAKGMQLVFGAVTGSISRGMARYDSDYDMRFLYVDKNKENKYSVDFKKEEDIIYRYFPTQEERMKNSTLELLDRFTFWELNSFLNLSCHPTLGDETLDPVGLYYITQHTFRSPYVWDPYGIQPFALNILDKYFNKKYLLEYYLRLISKEFEQEEKEVFTNVYLEAIWAALSIRWVLDRNNCAPIQIQVLLSDLESLEMRKKINRVLQDCYAKGKEYNLQNSKITFYKDNPIAARQYHISNTDLCMRGASRDKIKVSVDGQLREFILKMQSVAIKECQHELLSSMDNKFLLDSLPELYSIINHLEVKGVD